MNARHAVLPIRPLWSQRQFLLGICFAVSGLIAWWQLRSDPATGPARRASSHLPDVVVLQFAAVETDATGQLGRRLTADELRHFVDEDRSELVRPHLELFQPEGPPWQVSAREGLVLAGGDQIRLIEDVQVERAGSETNRPLHAETARMDLWRAQARAETDLPVRLVSNQDVLNANGMHLWYREPTHTVFHGRVRIKIMPDTAPDAPTAQEAAP